MEVHFVLGTQRLLDLEGNSSGWELIEVTNSAYPVSRITLNYKVGSGPMDESKSGALTVWGGVPI